MAHFGLASCVFRFSGLSRRYISGGHLRGSPTLSTPPSSPPCLRRRRVLGRRFLPWGPFGLGILLGIRLPPLALRTPARMGSVTFGGSPLSSFGFGLLGAMRALRVTRVFVSRTSSFRNCARARRVWMGMLAKSCVVVSLLKRTALP